jgi:hypothetical protein
MPLLTHRIGSRLLQVDYGPGFDGAPDIRKIWIRDLNGVQSLKPEQFGELNCFGFDVLELSLMMEEGLIDPEEA